MKFGIPSSIAKHADNKVSGKMIVVALRSIDDIMQHAML
jgi:hypothetical protein